MQRKYTLDSYPFYERYCRQNERRLKVRQCLTFRSVRFGGTCFSHFSVKLKQPHALLYIYYIKDKTGHYEANLTGIQTQHRTYICRLINFLILIIFNTLQCNQFLYRSISSRIFPSKIVFNPILQLIASYIQTIRDVGYHRKLYEYCVI